LFSSSCGTLIVFCDDHSRTAQIRPAIIHL
jgi:hypothetical protein